MANNDNGRGLSVCCGLVAEIFGITALVLMLVWLLHFRDGLNLNSHHPNRIFNVHPFLMFFGFMFFLAQALITHGGLDGALTLIIAVPCRVLAICLGIVGLHAAFKSHDMLNFGSDMRSVHSWIGITAFSLFLFECGVWLLSLVGVLTCCPQVIGNSGETSRDGPSGRIVLYMATCAAVTGLMEVASKGLDDHLRRDHRETTIINVLALFIVLFVAAVDVSVVYAPGYVGS